MNIYGVSGSHLGDVWASISFFLHTVKEDKIILSRYTSFDHGITHCDCSGTIEECVPMFKDASRIELTNSVPTLESPAFRDTFRIPVVPTKVTWLGGLYTIAYQFDGRSAAELKNPKPDEVAAFLNKCVEMGFKPVNLGGFKPVSICVDILSTAYAFVGISSGLLEVANSVDVPINLVLNDVPLGNVVDQYVNRKYNLYQRLGDINFTKLQNISVSGELNALTVHKGYYE